MHHVDGADGSGAGGDQEAELGFWKAVIEADLILDLGGGVGQGESQWYRLPASADD